MSPFSWALLPETARAILRIFHGFQSRGQDIFTKQSTLARMIGCTRLTVWRWIRELARRGLIRILSRHSRFCRYSIETTPETTGDTSHRRSSLINRFNGDRTPPFQKKAPPPDRLPEMDNGLLWRLAIIEGVEWEEAKRRATVRA
jgi:biotin operon repressor